MIYHENGRETERESEKESERSGEKKGAKYISFPVCIPHGMTSIVTQPHSRFS